MTNEAQFLAAIHDDPRDFSLRYVYADWRPCGGVSGVAGTFGETRPSVAAGFERSWPIEAVGGSSVAPFDPVSGDRKFRPGVVAPFQRELSASTLPPSTTTRGRFYV